MKTVEIELRSLDDSSYDNFMSELKLRYSTDRMTSNLLGKDEAIEFTENQWASFLPEGKSTEGHYFFDMISASDNTKIGVSWLFINRNDRTSFIYELFLVRESRGKGLGRFALRALEACARSKGARTLGLNVFADNDRAKSLYTSFGFRDVSTDMIKSI